MADDASHHVGAKPLPLPAGVVAGAVYGGHSACYRYTLDWHTDDIPRDEVRGEPTVMWLLMNPSVASERAGDRTVLKCWRYTRRWGYRRMVITNSAAYRATDQARLAEVPNPVGSDNAWWLRHYAASAALIVVAHGKPKLPAAQAYGPAAVAVLRQALRPLHVLRLSADGTPCHPLYLPETLTPQPWPAA